MHLIYLCMDPGIPVGGTKGAAVHVEAITAAMAAAGHRVTILAARTAEGGRSTCPVEVLALDDGSRRSLKATADLVARYLPSYRLDRDLRAILTNATLAGHLTRRFLDLDGEIILERLSLFGVAGLEAARAAGLKHAVEINAPLTQEALEFRGLIAAPLARALEREVLLGTDLVLPVSRSLEDYCLGLGTAAERIAVVPNGVDLGRFTPLPARAEATRAALDLTVEDRVVGVVSGFRAWHGGVDLANAFAAAASVNPRARLLVVGDGPERPPMEEILDRAQLTERARFLGTVPHDQVPTYLEAMDVAVAPYRPAAGFYFSPLKIYEYMAMGLAIVAPRLGQIAEVIEDGVNGRLTTPGDSTHLARTIAELLDDADQRRRLGGAARNSAEKHHDWSRSAARIGLILQGLVDKAGIESTTAANTQPAGSMVPFGAGAGQCSA